MNVVLLIDQIVRQTSGIAGGWKVTASSSQVMNQPGDLLYNPPENALDGILSTRWSSGKPQTGGEWFELDFGQTLSVRSLELDMGADASVQSYMDFPRGYFVSVSDTPNDTTAPTVTSGVGEAPITHIDLRGERHARYVRILQTNEATNWWSIHELRADVSWPLSAASPTP
jgi:endo-1,3(4)-beta-glucanase